MATYISIRVSSQEQATSGLGMEAQEAECREFAQAQGLTVDRVFVDAGWSRKTYLDERPGMAELLATLKRGDTVIVHKHDRIGDSVAIAMITRELKRKRCQLLVVNGDNTGSDESLLMVGILGVMSDHELRQISSRTKRALEQKKQRGQRYCRKVYGFDHTETGELVPNESEQATIRRIVEMREELGLTLRQIADVLNEDGVKPPEGAKWYSATVGRISTRYSGTGAVA